MIITEKGGGTRLAIKAAGIVTKHVEVKEQSCCIWQNVIPAAAAAAAAAAFGALQCLYTENQGSNKILCQPQATHGSGVETHKCMLNIAVGYTTTSM